jgi:hypothetical protein
MGDEIQDAKPQDESKPEEAKPEQEAQHAPIDGKAVDGSDAVHECKVGTLKFGEGRFHNLGNGIFVVEGRHDNSYITALGFPQWISDTIKSHFFAQKMKDQENKPKIFGPGEQGRQFMGGLRKMFNNGRH